MSASTLPRVVGPQQLAAVIATRPEVRLLDVRTPSEFERRRIAGSYNVPLDRLAAHANDIGRVRAPIVLVCRSGARARAAEDVLRRACGRNLHVLDGGLTAWRQQRLATDGTPVSPAAIVRRVLGVAGLAFAVVFARENPLVGLFAAFLGLRLAFGQSVLPCTATGACSVPAADTQAIVDAFVAGTRPDGNSDDSAPGDTVRAIS